jgi:DNA-binding LacI/PurR family transcriptional regulator
MSWEADAFFMSSSEQKDKSGEITVAPSHKPFGRPPGPQSQHRQIAELVTQRLLKGEWAPRAPLPSLRQLAKHYNVGLQVIRLALARLLSEDRVALNARRQVIANVQNPGPHVTSNCVALVISYDMPSLVASQSGMDILAGIHQGIARTPYPLLLVHGSKDLRKSIPGDLLELPLRGVLLYGQFSMNLLREYEKLAIPVALVDHPAEDRQLHSASLNNVEATFEATTRLIDMGHRRLAFMRVLHVNVNKIDPDSRERQRGFTQAVETAGLPPDDVQIFTFSSGTLPNGPTMQAFFRARPRFTAIVAVDGNCAEIIRKAAQLVGLSVPRDLSIICFRGQNESGPDWSGPRVDFKKLGCAAVELLDKPLKPALNTKIDTYWHPGNTVAPPHPDI